MTRKKKRVILLLLLFLLLAVIGMLVWIFFLPKKYTVMYHISGNRTIESAEVILYGRQESGEYGYSMYLLEDKDNLEKIEKALSGMKMYPCHITKLSDITEATAEDRKWLRTQSQHLWIFHEFQTVWTHSQQPYFPVPGVL